MEKEKICKLVLEDVISWWVNSVEIWCRTGFLANCDFKKIIMIKQPIKMVMDGMFLVENLPLTLSVVLRYISSLFLRMWFLFTSHLRTWAIIVLQMKCEFYFCKFYCAGNLIFIFKVQKMFSFYLKGLYRTSVLLWKCNPVPVTWFNVPHMFSHLNFASFGCGFFFFFTFFLM